MEPRPVVHPALDTLAALRAGKLDAATAAAVIAHVKDCPECCRQAVSRFGEVFLARIHAAGGHAAAPGADPSLVSGAYTTLPPVPGATAAPAGSVPSTDFSPRGDALPSVGVLNLPAELAGNPNYQILRELGRGGMGVVYLAKNVLMDRPEVLKVVNKALLDHTGATGALHSLAAIGPDVAPALPLLLELLRRAETAAMCDELANVLGAIGPEAEEAVPALAELLLERHPAGDEESAGRAAYALRSIGSSEAIAALIKALDGTDTRFFRYVIVGVLAGLGKKAAAAIPRLEELLKMPDSTCGAADAIRSALEWIDPSRRK